MRLLLFISFLFVTASLDSQNLDSLRNELSKAKHDTTILNVLNELNRYADDEEFCSISVKMERICRAGLKKIKFRNREHTLYTEMLAGSLNNMGYCAINHGKTDKAINYYEEALQYHNTSYDKAGYAATLNNLGSAYEDIGDIAKALDYYHKALDAYEEIPDKMGIAYALNNIGAIHLTQGDTSKGTECYLKSLRLLEEIGDKEGVANISVNIGFTYAKKDEKKAQEYYLKSISIFSEIKEERGLAKAMRNLAHSLTRVGNTAEAKIYNQKAAQIFEKLKALEDLAGCEDAFGEIYIKEGNFIAAEKHAMKGYQLSRSLGYPEQILNSAYTLRKIYKELGQFEEALKMHKLQIRMRDSIKNESTQKAALKQQLRYEYGKKAAADSVKIVEEKRITEANLSENKAKLEAQSTQRNALLAGLAIVLCFSALMFNRFRVANNQKKIIEIQKRQVEEKQREVIDSIRYAKRIQNALLPSEKQISKTLHNSKRSFFLLVMITIAGLSYSQNLDSLTKELGKLKPDPVNDTAKCYILNILIDNATDPVSQKSFNQNMLKTAEERLRKLTAQSPLYKTYCRYLGVATHNGGFFADREGNAYKAIELFSKSIEFSRKGGNRVQESSSLNNLGFCYFSHGDLPSALKYYQQALKLREENKDEFGIAESFNHIAGVYANTGEKDKALEYFRKSLAIREKLGGHKQIAESLSNIGGTFGPEQVDSALSYYFRALDHTKGEEFLYTKGTIMLNIGHAYAAMNKTEKALGFLAQSLKIGQQIDDRETVAAVLINRSRILLRSNDLKTAADEAMEALSLSKKLGYPEYIAVSASVLVEIFEKQKKFREALEMYELSVHMNDSIDNEMSRRATMQQQFRYEYGKKAAADSVKHIEAKRVNEAMLAESKAKLRQEETRRYAMYGGIALFTLFSVFIVRRFRHTTSQRKMIEHQKMLVEEKQKEILDSIRYAKRIQQSLLPTEKYIERVLRN